MTENPYRLARDIRGIGFKTADAIAMKLGIEKTAMVRVRAGISYALTEAMDKGHCGLPTEELIPLPKSCSRFRRSSSALRLISSCGTIARSCRRHPLGVRPP
jgi:ATP-dependent exoDNAse (exonuclease V) alpha subunit